MAAGLRFVSLLSLLLLFAAGCQNKESQVATEWREKLLVSEAPSDSRPLAEVRQELASLGDAGGQRVVVRGTVGNMPNPYSAEETVEEFPWVSDEASFFLVDDETVAEFKKHGHAKGEECSYCLKLASQRTDRIAQVQILDSQGAPVPYRADQLLGLKEGDRLVIAGQGTLHLDTLMVVEPEAIYVDTAPASSEEEPSQPLPPEQSE